jgi:hypothetical protein
MDAGENEKMEEILGKSLSRQEGNFLSAAGRRSDSWYKSSN